MSVRVRRQNGTALDVDKSEAVEILSSEGQVAVVVMTDHRGSIKVLVPPDPLFTAYCRSQGLTPAKNVTVHDPFVGRPMGARG